MTAEDYWKECIETAAADCDLSLTTEQLDCLGSNVQCSHENYGLAFYNPSSDCGPSHAEREWKGKYDSLQREFDSFRDNAETAVKKALRQYPESQVTIGEHGEVFRHGGRTEQIQ